MNNMTITTPIPMRHAELVPDRGPTEEQMQALRHFARAVFPIDTPEHLLRAVSQLCDMGFMELDPLSTQGNRARIKLKGMAFLEYAAHLGKEDADRKFMTM